MLSGKNYFQDWPKPALANDEFMYPVKPIETNVLTRPGLLKNYWGLPVVPEPSVKKAEDIIKELPLNGQFYPQAQNIFNNDDVKSARFLKPTLNEIVAAKYPLVRKQNTRQDWKAKSANAVSDFMVTNPIARAYGLMYQGVADAGLNLLGYVARGYGLDTRPLEPRNFIERAFETIPRTAYNAAALKMGYNVVKPALSYGGSKLAHVWHAPKIYGKVNKIAEATLNPAWEDWIRQSMAVGGMEALFNPQSELGKYGTTVMGLGLLNIKNPTELLKAPFQKGFINKVGALGRQSPAQTIKSITRHPKMQDFVEDVLIGEGIKRYVGNRLDPRAHSSTSAQNAQPLTSMADTNIKPASVFYNPSLKPAGIAPFFPNAYKKPYPMNMYFDYTAPAAKESAPFINPPFINSLRKPFK